MSNLKKINSYNQITYGVSTKLNLQSKAFENSIEKIKKVNKDDNCSIKSLTDASECRENDKKLVANNKVKIIIR